MAHRLLFNKSAQSASGVAAEEQSVASASEVNLLGPRRRHWFDSAAGESAYAHVGRDRDRYARQSTVSRDAVVLTIRAAVADLVELPLSPPLNATARFGLITIATRTAPPLMDKVRTLIQSLLRD